MKMLMKMKWNRCEKALVWCAVAILSGMSAVNRASAQGQAEHVVVLVWDGMRPDFITPQYCPTLYSLATNGTFFRRNHCVFVSTTQANGAALATGSNPGRNGIQANVDFRPELNFLTTTPRRVSTPCAGAIC